MSLQKIVEYAQQRMAEIARLHDRKWAEMNDLPGGDPRFKIAEKYNLLINPIEEEVRSTLARAFVFPSGITLEKIGAEERFSSTSRIPSKLELSLSLGSDSSGELNFHRLYAQAFEFRSQLLSLGYQASVTYTPNSFVHDSFDPRAFTTIKMSKKGWSFTDDPYLQREELGGEEGLKISGEYSQKYGSITFYSDGRNAWNPVLREIIHNLGGTAQVKMNAKEYAQARKGQSWWNRFTSVLLGDFPLREKVISRQAIQLAKVLMMEAANIKFTGSGRTYEKDLTAKGLEDLEQRLGTSVMPYIRWVKIPVDAQDTAYTRNVLQALASHLQSASVPGTSPGKCRISQEQAEAYLQDDLTKVQQLADAVPLSSFFAYQRLGGRSIVSGSRNDSLHLSLLRKLDTLTTLYLKELFKKHSYDNFDPFEKNNLQKQREPDKYHPSSVEELMRELRRVHVPQELQQEVFQKLNARKTDLFETYLTIHELYALEIAALQQVWQREPEVLLDRYRKQYWDVPSTPLEITAFAGDSNIYSQGFPHPFQMTFGGEVHPFGINDGDKDITYNYLSVERNNKGIWEFRLRIDLENPILLPLQQYALKLLGITTSENQVKTSALIS